MGAVALIRFMQMEIIPVNMLARMSDREEEGKGQFTRLVRNCSGMVLFPSSDEVRKGEVTGSARAVQEKERGAMAWANVKAGAGIRFGVDALWGSVMKKWLVVVAVSFGAVGGVYAQETDVLVVARENDSSSAETVQGTNRALVPFSSTNSLNRDDYFLAPGLKLSFAELVAPEFGAAKMAAPMASPAQGPKRHTARESDDYRLQIGLGFTYVRFRSAAFDVGLYGLNTSVVYFPSQWLGVEANFTAAFGPHVFNNNIDQTRYAGITGGPKILWRKEGWEPWAHALVGIAHVNPQLGDVSKNGVAVQMGGGVDFPVLDGMFWLRIEGDYIRSQLYKMGQDNFQGVVGVVFHFF